MMRPCLECKTSENQEEKSSTKVWAGEEELRACTLAQVIQGRKQITPCTFDLTYQYNAPPKDAAQAAQTIVDFHKLLKERQEEMRKELSRSKADHSCVNVPQVTNASSSVSSSAPCSSSSSSSTPSTSISTTSAASTPVRMLLIAQRHTKIWLATSSFNPRKVDWEGDNFYTMSVEDEAVVAYVQKRQAELAAELADESDESDDSVSSDEDESQDGLKAVQPVGKKPEKRIETAKQIHGATQAVPMKNVRRRRDISRIRVRCPHHLWIQGDFQPHETVGAVYDWLECVLLDPSSPSPLPGFTLPALSLVITPPRQVLKDKSQTLQSLGLVPNGVLVYSAPAETIATWNKMWEETHPGTGLIRKDLLPLPHPPEPKP